MNKLAAITIKLLIATSLVSPLYSQAAQQNANTAKAQQYLDDSTITSKVKHKLLSAKTDLDGVSVTTQHGVVTLTGFTANEDKKALAETLAQRVGGVKQVKNELVIDASKVTTQSYLSDSAITAKVKAKLLADKDISANDVKVETKNGTVLLRGKVNKQAQLTKILAIVNDTQGVQKVANQLKVVHQ